MTPVQADNYRILFVEAPYSYGGGDLVVGKYFPLGIGYLASYLRSHGAQARIFQAGPGDHDAQLLSAIREFQPDMACISVMTPSYPRAAALCREIKAAHGCVTVLGGHHVSAVGTEVLAQCVHADYAVAGEGENALLALVAALRNGETDLSHVPGLVWRDADGAARQNPQADLITDLDALPFPARDLVDMSRYRLHSYIDFGKRSATMITSRGCPFKCMFCSSWLTMGSKYRFRSVENIMQEIRELTGRWGVDHIVFEDDTMTLKRERMLALCAELERMKNRPTWYCLSRVDSMDLELARAMKRAGCRMVNFGIESGSPEILKKIGKKISLDKAREAVSACDRAGLRTQCTFIVGFPYDTRETMAMTWEAARVINPSIAIFFPLTPYPGTRVFNEHLDKSRRPQSVAEWERFLMTANTSGVSVHSEFSGAQLRAIADQYNRKFFLRPAKALHLMKTAHGIEDIIRLARGAVYLAHAAVKKQ